MTILCVRINIYIYTYYNQQQSQVCQVVLLSHLRMLTKTMSHRLFPIYLSYTVGKLIGQFSLSLYIYTHIHMYRYLTCEIIPKILPENALGSIGNFWSIINYISLINDYIWTIIKYIDAISIGPPPTRLYICQFHLQFVNWWIWSLIYNISTNYTYIYINYIKTRLY